MNSKSNSYVTIWIIFSEFTISQHFENGSPSSEGLPPSRNTSWLRSLSRSWFFSELIRSCKVSWPKPLNEQNILPELFIFSCLLPSTVPGHPTFYSQRRLALWSKPVHRKESPPGKLSAFIPYSRKSLFDSRLAKQKSSNAVESRRYVKIPKEPLLDML